MRSVLTRSCSAVFLVLHSPLCDLAPAEIVLRDVAKESGIDFEHSDGGCGNHSFVEQVGGGVAFLDFDGDERQDLLFTSGTALPGCAPVRSRPTRLFRNLGGGRFRDATEETGLVGLGYATGIAAADLDGDGDEDLFVAAYGPDRLYRNDGGRFVEVGAAAGVDDAALGASACLFDADRDGDLDLYVANYVDAVAGRELECRSDGIPVYCKPQDHPGAPDRFFRQEAAWRFVDATRDSGLWSPRHRGLGVVAGDFDDDGDPDLCVANDSNENQLFVNDGRGRFAERGVEAGIAFSEDGAMQNGMGVDAGDFDGDGRLDLVVTNFSTQPNSLWRNRGNGQFDDVSYTSGIGAPSLPYVGWSALFADLDADGRQDLFIANGHVFENAERILEGTTYRQPHLLHRNLGEGRFGTQAFGAQAGLPLRSGRGAAAGDIDDDGDLDVVVQHQNEAPFLLRNDTPRQGRWLGLRLRGQAPNTSAIGARVTLRAAGFLQVREFKSSSGYLSRSDPRVLFALPEGAKIDSLSVRWPSGRSEEISARVAFDRYQVIEEKR